MESCDDAIISKTLDGVISSWNRGAAEIFGYTADEAIGRPIQILFPPHRLDEEDAFVARIQNGERVDHFETVRRRKDGSDFHASVTISPIRDADGLIIGASKVLRDISLAHKTQTELHQAKLDLEQVVAERTQALGERDLLLREVYHRVKNNLQVVDGLLVLEARRLHDPVAKVALMGLRSRVFALALVHQQLMRAPDLRTLDVGGFLRELVHNLVDGAGDGRVTLTVEAGPLEANLDFATPLGMLVTEIVSNCLKHAFPLGGGRVSLSLRPGKPGWVELVVADNGVGLPADAVVSENEDRGSAIVRKLVAQLGGQMTVQSDAGAVIEIALPHPELSWAS